VRLTAADRVPQVGDVMYGESGQALAIGEILGGSATDGYKVLRSGDTNRHRWFTVAPWWRYRFRADGGAVTIDGGETD
jgi:hypothetical protein